jgi:hypothetical protein
MDYTVQQGIQDQGYDQARERYFQLLQLKSKLNLDHQISTEMGAAQVQEMKPQERDPRDLMYDSQYQQQQARANLVTIMLEQEVDRVISQASESELRTTNTYFSDIVKKYGGKTREMVTAEDYLDWLRNYIDVDLGQGEAQRGPETDEEKNNHWLVTYGQEFHFKDNGADKYVPNQGLDNDQKKLESRRDWRKIFLDRFWGDSQWILSTSDAHAFTDRYSQVPSDKTQFWTSWGNLFALWNMMPAFKFELDYKNEKMNAASFWSYLNDFFGRNKQANKYPNDMDGMDGTAAHISESNMNFKGEKITKEDKNGTSGRMSKEDLVRFWNLLKQYGVTPSQDFPDPTQGSSTIDYRMADYIIPKEDEWFENKVEMSPPEAGDMSILAKRQRSFHDIMLNPPSSKKKSGSDVYMTEAEINGRYYPTTDPNCPSMDYLMVLWVPRVPPKTGGYTVKEIIANYMTNSQYLPYQDDKKTHIPTYDQWVAKWINASETTMFIKKTQLTLWMYVGSKHVRDQLNAVITGSKKSSFTAQEMLDLLDKNSTTICTYQAFHGKTSQYAILDKYKSATPPLSQAQPTTGKGFYSKKSHVLRVGRGVGSNNNHRWLTFGKYVIHTPSLHDQSLNIKTKAGNPVSAIGGTKTISRPLTNVLTNMLAGHDVHNILDSLCADDKRLLKSVCETADVEDDVWGAGVLRKEFVHDKDKDFEEKEEELDRFDMLKNEVIAGNNNPDVLRELKALILTMMRDGRLRRNEAYGVLAELSLITSS